VFPSIIVARRPTDGPVPATARVCAIPREQLRIIDLRTQFTTEGFDIERSRLTSEAWSLEPKAVVDLLAKLRDQGMPLAEFAGVRPYRGILTGFNEAFLIDTTTKNDLFDADPACAEIVRPFIRGQDVKRWHPDWAGLWMLALKSSADYAWPWSSATDSDVAEQIFRRTYPSLYARLKPMQEALTRSGDTVPNSVDN